MIAYHVAPRALREDIRRHGLVSTAPAARWGTPENSVEAPPQGVYLWDTVERAQRYADGWAVLLEDPEIGACDVWEVRLWDQVGKYLQVHEDPILGHQGALYVEYNVPASLVKLLS